MGIANLLPGISGGTIAFVSGRYDSIIEAMADLLRLKLKKDEIFLLIRIGIGAAVAIFSLSKLVDHLYESFPRETTSFFAGLIAGGLVFLGKRLKFKTAPMVMIGIGALVMIVLSRAGAISNGGILGIGIGGFLAGGAMILPGISGSSILVVMGVYEEAIRAVSDLNIPVLSVLGISAILGVLVFSLLLEKLLKIRESETMAFLYGLTLSGLVLILSSGFSFSFLVLGFAAMILLEKVM